MEFKTEGAKRFCCFIGWLKLSHLKDAPLSFFGGTEQEGSLTAELWDRNDGHGTQVDLVNLFGLRNDANRAAIETLLGIAKGESIFPWRILLDRGGARNDLRKWQLNQARLRQENVKFIFETQAGARENDVELLTNFLMHHSDGAIRKSQTLKAESAGSAVTLDAIRDVVKHELSLHRTVIERPENNGLPFDSVKKLAMDLIHRDLKELRLDVNIRVLALSGDHSFPGIVHYLPGMAKNHAAPDRIVRVEMLLGDPDQLMVKYGEGLGEIASHARFVSSEIDKQIETTKGTQKYKVNYFTYGTLPPFHGFMINQMLFLSDLTWVRDGQEVKLITGDNLYWAFSTDGDGYAKRRIEVFNHWFEYLRDYPKPAP